MTLRQPHRLPPVRSTVTSFRHDRRSACARLAYAAGVFAGGWRWLASGGTAQGRPRWE